MKTLGAIAILTLLFTAGCGYHSFHERRSELRHARDDFRRAGWEAREELRRAHRDVQRELRQAHEEFRREMQDARRDIHDEFRRW